MRRPLLSLEAKRLEEKEHVGGLAMLMAAGRRFLELQPATRLEITFYDKEELHIQNMREAAKNTKREREKQLLREA